MHTRHSATSDGSHTRSFELATATETAARSPLVAMLLKGAKSANGLHRCNLLQAASELGINAHAAHAELAALHLDGVLRLELQDPALYVRLLRTPRPSELHTLAVALHGRMRGIDALQRVKLNASASMLWTLAGQSSAPLATGHDCGDGHKACGKFSAILERYFTLPIDEGEWAPPVGLLKPLDGKLRGDVLDIVTSSLQHVVRRRARGKAIDDLSGLAIARILHGMESPAYPRKVWDKTCYWGKHTKVDFEAIRQHADDVIETVRRRCRHGDARIRREQVRRTPVV